MNRLAIYGLLFLLGLLAAAQAKPPVVFLPAKTVAFEYGFSVRSQTITNARVGSEEKLHQVSACYVLFPWLRLSAGLGGERFTVSEYHGRVFNGAYGLTPSAAIYLSSPWFAGNLLCLNADVEALYLNSRDEGYRYSGPVTDPSLGLAVKLGSQANLETGARWHIIKGTMRPPTGASAPFSNNDNLLGFLTLTAHSPAGVYMQLGLAASPQAAGDSFKDGLKDVAISLKVGLFLLPPIENSNDGKQNKSVFPDYDNLRKRQESMAKDLE